MQIIDDVAAMIDGIHEVLADDCPDQALLLPLGEGRGRRGSAGRNQSALSAG